MRLVGRRGRANLYAAGIEPLGRNRADEPRMRRRRPSSNRVECQRRTMPLAVGTRFGSYEISAVIGAGGMGQMYRAHDN